jgi:hypothetical protein
MSTETRTPERAMIFQWLSEILERTQAIGIEKTRKSN